MRSAMHCRKESHGLTDDWFTILHTVEGMNPQEITQLMKDATSDLEFTGFPLENRGWYVHGVGAETRSQSEARAAKFYTWLCEHLDEQLYGSDAETNDDVFDAGVALPEEEHECEHDLFTPKTRKRRTTLLIGHGDFMSLVLKRIVAGFGHVVETEGIPHRTYSHDDDSNVKYLFIRIVAWVRSNLCLFS